MKVSTNRPNALASWSSRVIKLLGLFLVMLVVWNVCQSRLDALRSDRAAGMVGYVSADDRLKQLEENRLKLNREMNRNGQNVDKLA